jgi:hypothetical protein
MKGDSMRDMLTIALVLACGGIASAGPQVRGDYAEARTCDVWTGPCFANGEINLRGECAVAAWAVREGTWRGVALDGLAVVAVLRAEGTLHTEAEGRVQAALFVDEKATPAQERALVDLARTLAPERLADVASVERKPVSFSREGVAVRLSAGPDLTLRTEPLCHGDAICCNEERAYPPVSGGVEVECARSAEHAYRGAALGGVRWSGLNKRSAMVGVFEK